MRFRNFKIWHGRLPHWRADDVVYYVTFRHRRPLTPEERLILFQKLLRPDGSRWDLLALAVLSEQTEILFRVRDGRAGEPIELGDIVEPAKRKAGTLIAKRSQDPRAPFWHESFDRIVRDPMEFQERWNHILELAQQDVEADLELDPEIVFRTIHFVEEQDAFDAVPEDPAPPSDPNSAGP